MEYRFYDILNKQRPEHKDDSFAARHPKMRRQDRAKIFAPFAALSGHAEQTHSVRRITAEKIELSQDDIDKINIILQDMGEKLDIKQPVYAEIMYFVPDPERENEGQYRLYKGLVKKIDVTFGKIFAEDIVIDFGDIYSVVPERDVSV